MLEPDARKPLTVSELNREARSILESGLSKLWIEGEISGLTRPASGHLYFRLKDAKAQLSAAFFRQRQRGPTHSLKNGDQVLVFGRVSIYEARGDFQLIVEQVEPAGEGVLKREYERLRRMLAEEGLFDESKKRQLPRLPQRIGIITSPTGAAIRDMLTVLQRRFPAVPVVIYPASVQGALAPGELVSAVELANRRAECDVLILSRGGGSLEDLWAFNDEKLARAIADSDIPTVSAVGHEIDFTIADFVADLRAPTPSGAAEMVVPDQEEWQQRFQSLETRLARIQGSQLDGHAQAIDWLQRRLSAASPARRLERQTLFLQSLQQRLRAAVREQMHDKQQRSQALVERLHRRSPAQRVQHIAARTSRAAQRLHSSWEKIFDDRQHRLALVSRALHSVSPLATLSRGYAIVTDVEGRALTNAKNTKAGDIVQARLAEGSLLATVQEVSSSSRKSDK